MIDERRRAEAFELYKELVHSSFAVNYATAFTVAVAAAGDGGPVMRETQIASQAVNFDELAVVAFRAVDAFDHVAGTDK